MSEHAPRLAEHVRDRGPLAPDTAARLLLPVAESLAELHAAERVHGAVSPAAIEVGGAGAALLAPGASAPERVFLAPEVAAGARPGPAADVWSFAGVLHHTATGRPPYARPSGPRDGGWLRPLTELALLPEPADRPSMADVVGYLRARVGDVGKVERTAPSAASAVPPAMGRSGGVALGILGAAVIVLLAVVGAGLVLAGGASDQGDAGRAGDGRPSASSPAPSTRPAPRRTTTGTATPRPPTAARLERFARRYVATASRDPDRGFTRLTRDYQQQSPRYHEFWSSIEDPRILSVSADPGAMTVAYTYRYALPDGARRTEAVTLHLVRRGDRLLIAGSSARQL
ncbi:hypothetical protein [Nocardioides sp. SYSU DS0651]|uniref:hypothetical protein n=1 Tax=Nocardioides sp. SYSU DS0651 TaxID=3415955 RepID=UPI003F4BDB65